MGNPSRMAREIAESIARQYQALTATERDSVRLTGERQPCALCDGIGCQRCGYRGHVIEPRLVR